jgi:hypothetical protein
MARLQISGQNEERLDKNAHFCMRLTQPWIDALHFVHPPNLPPPNDIFQAKPMLSLRFPSYADQEFPLVMIDSSPSAQAVAQVGMAALIK